MTATAINILLHLILLEVNLSLTRAVRKLTYIFLTQHLKMQNMASIHDTLATLHYR
jgi:hypothetical protein